MEIWTEYGCLYHDGSLTYIANLEETCFLDPLKKLEHRSDKGDYIEKFIVIFPKFGQNL